MGRLKELRKYADYDDHAHKGANLAREILGELKLTDDAEKELICSAIYHHSDKLITDNPMDEVLKDADTQYTCIISYIVYPHPFVHSQSNC